MILKYVFPFQVRLESFQDNTQHIEEHIKKQRGEVSEKERIRWRLIERVFTGVGAWSHLNVWHCNFTPSNIRSDLSHLHNSDDDGGGENDDGDDLLS